LVRLDYETAIGHSEAAVRIVPASHPEVSQQYSFALAVALQQYGDEQGKNDALVSAIDVWRTLVAAVSHKRTPLGWATMQHNSALRWMPGERQSGTARFEEAVAAYRSALLERTRERVPLEWATTQSNLGAALRALSKQESGTARLEDAVGAFRSTLQEYTRERVPLDWAATQNIWAARSGA
jgi:tetratricopeptide (TPR) repeat protein